MFAEIVLAASIAIYIYHRWIEDQPASPIPPQLQIPRTTEGSPIPLVYGQCRIRSPIMAWAGNYFTPTSSYTPWGPGPNVPAGSTVSPNFYAVDVLFCLGVPFYASTAQPTYAASTLRGAWAGDTPMGMTINSTGGTPNEQQFYAAPGQPSDFMFGGIYYRGTWDQNVLDKQSVVPPTIPNGGAGFWPDGIVYDNHSTGTSLFAAAKQANADTSIPGCRGQMMLYAHIAIGQNSSLPAFQFEVLSTQTGSLCDLGNSFSFDLTGVSTDADPAAVIMDMLVSPWGKVGLSFNTLLSQINVASFEAASDTLFAEQHGYSRAFEQPADADAMIRDVLAQVDGMLYQEPTTGQLTLKLVRFDYDPTTLDDVNPSNMEPPGADWYTVQGWAEVPNQVRVTYRNRSDNYAESVAVAQDASLIVTNGGRVRSVSVRYEGCCVATLAGQLAARELAAVGRPMVRAVVVVDRSFYAKRPGDVVTLTWPDLGISKMVMRIAAIDFGMLHSGKIKMSLMRDVFDQKVGAFF